jgi:ketosteroid isomerase-like protein
MIFVTHSLPVNEIGEPVVTRAMLWNGLVAKANNALPFVPAITHCDVLVRNGQTSFDREIEAHGAKFVERVTLEEPHRVVYTRLNGPVLGTIINEIQDHDGDLTLRFSFALAVAGAPDGSREEREHAEEMTAIYKGSVATTLDAIRNLAAEQPTIEPEPHAQSANEIQSDWISHYYADVDAMRVQSFVNRHSDDAVLVFGNNPPLVGKAAITEAMKQFWSMLQSSYHERRNLWFVDEGDTAIVEWHVHYETKSGRKFVVPSVTVLDRGPDGLVTSLRVHVDLAPLYEELDDPDDPTATLGETPSQQTGNGSTHRQSPAGDRPGP